MDIPLLLIIIILLAFIFDYINGFHDSANSIATVISTKVLTPFQAVLWAAMFNFIAFFISKYLIGEFKVGNTIASSVNENFINLEVILAGLVAAIIWNLITWWYGIPSSSSHTLIGGFIGAALAHAGGFSGANGVDVINYVKVIPIFLFIFMAPFIGIFFGFAISAIIINLFKKSNPLKAERLFKKLQLISSAMLSLGHGGNDAQKVMGIIGAAVIYFHVQIEQDPFWINSTDRFDLFVNHWEWVPFTSFLIIGLGTLSGGWKIIKTMGTRITKVTPLEGVSAETAGALTLYLSEFLGIPVSTTHTIVGGIIGVGMTKRVSAVRWGVTISLVWAWILTIPVSAVIAAATYYIIMLF